MPTFPQHRNLKASKNTGASESSLLSDQTNNLPAISDLVSLSNVKLRLNLSCFGFVPVGVHSKEEKGRLSIVCVDLSKQFLTTYFSVLF